MHDLCKYWGEYLKEMKGVFIDNKDYWMTNEVKQSRALDSSAEKYKGETASVKLSQA